MPYSVELNEKGRFDVTAPSGKKWKRSYPSQEAAQKGIDYVMSRFGNSSETPAPAAQEAENVEADDRGRTPLDMTKPGSHTLRAMRHAQEAF